MDEADEAVLAAVLPTVPKLAPIAREDLEITRLGGLTNIVFRVVLPEGAAADSPPVLCLRCPGPGTESYINRAEERVSAAAAARAGVGPQVLHFSDDGVMLMPMLPGETMSVATFASREGAAGRAGAALRKLHTSGETFEAKFELFQMIDKYLAELGTDAQLPVGYAEALETAQGVRQALDARKPLPCAPCHCDPLCENFIDDAEGGVMRIVDFEYAGMNDPLWDLGDLSVEAGLDAVLESELLGAYFEGTGGPSAAEIGRVVLYKAMCDLLWTLWGLIQHKNGNPAEDFWKYATERFQRCQALMASPEFESHVSAVRAG
jgi:thiamine kinase-like enzyme|eukprot:COSAG01_NODE_12937_length_1660_cov_1.163997_1_plen_320_part_00